MNKPIIPNAKAQTLGRAHKPSYAAVKPPAPRPAPRPNVNPAPAPISTSTPADEAVTERPNPTRPVHAVEAPPSAAHGDDDTMSKPRD